MKKIASIILGLILSISSSSGLTLLCGENKEKLEAPGIDKYSIVIGEALEGMGEPEIGFSFPVEKFTKKQILPVINLANAIFDDAYLQNLSLNEDERERLSKNNLFQNKEKVANIYQGRDLLAMIDDYIIVDYLNIPDLKNIIVDYIVDAITNKNFITSHFAKKSEKWQNFSNNIHSYMDADIAQNIQQKDSKMYSTWINTHTLQGHTRMVNLAVFSPDGNTIVTASYDNTAKIWDASTGNLLHNLQGHTRTVNSAVFSPDGSKIITLPSDNAAKIWDASAGNLLHNLQGHTLAVKSAVFSPDGNTIVTASYDNTAKIWDASTGNLLHNLQGHTRTVNSAVLSPDGSKIITLHSDNGAKIWNYLSIKHSLIKTVLMGLLIDNLKKQNKVPDFTKQDLYYNQKFLATLFNSFSDEEKIFFKTKYKDNFVEPQEYKIPWLKNTLGLGTAAFGGY